MNESRTEKNHDIAKEIDKEKNKTLRNKIIKTALIILLPILIVLAVIYFFIRIVGNMGLVVREYAVYKENLPSDFEGVKIVQFSDLHFNNNSSI